MGFILRTTPFRSFPRQETNCEKVAYEIFLVVIYFLIDDNNTCVLFIILTVFTALSVLQMILERSKGKEMVRDRRVALVPFW